MDIDSLTSTATHLRQIPERRLHATDKLRMAWQLLADAFRHSFLKGSQYADLRALVTRTQHVRYSEPLAFLQFASAVSDTTSVAAVDSTGFRDDVCDQAIRTVADWADSIAQLVDQERQAGHLGLIIDEAAGIVRRRGYADAAQFTPGSPEWRMFLSAWEAEEAGVLREQMLKDNPTAAMREARKAVKQNANQLLAILGVRLAPHRPPLLEVTPCR